MNEHDSDLPYEADEEEYISKTQIKNELKELTHLALELHAMGMTNLKKLELGENAIDAFENLGRARGNEGKKRQLKYVSKQLRELDREKLETAVARFKRGQPVVPKEDSKAGKLEALYNQLLNDGNTAMEAALNEHPELDRQQLRQLLRNAVKEKGTSKTKAQQKLQLYLKENL
ncbi:ribosome biogenesis factor YjgA [Pleionea sp. CnH1-48]|uniref:ribosome biogenesis factor YjgA n=1 Tax=Pleionea sp. CnH1-48 TaxID=2954494 RepID=UPI0020974E80|nr:ribosome biogenesis factor YjgA [Pleionea sp. CnH1-48]MCO7224042.1 DUF615 domain-containing protein [Pleionea sp. CnH1-48]